MIGINLTFTTSSLCFIHFSSSSWDGPARVVEGETCSPLVDDACIPVDNPHSDMTLSVINSIKNSSTTFSATLNASDICTRGKKIVGSGNNSEMVMR
jgi:hypothetical protein